MKALFSHGLRSLRWLLIGLLVGLARIYQWLVSPLLHMIAPGCGCRFYPTCSHYACEAVVTHGPISGSWLALRRLARCHPWGGSGIDPVPPHTDEGNDCSCTATKGPKGLRASPHTDS